MKPLRAAIDALALLTAYVVSRVRRGETTIVVRHPLLRFAVTFPWLTTAAIVVGGAFAGLLLLVSGIVPIKASSGHWAITRLFLDLAKIQSVSTHSIGIDAPALDDAALVLRGAGHYEGGCAPCHGRPGHPMPIVPAGMTPHPPDLQALVPRWTPPQLFSIVKHGIKFTGMPAFPVVERDDEIWAVVAFLVRLPGMQRSEYDRLVRGDVDPSSLDAWTSAGEPAPTLVRESCQRCHGLDGTGRGLGAFPSLAGQKERYLYLSLRAFADEQRLSGIMGPIAASLDDEAMHAAARYYAGLPPRAPATGDPAAIRRGAEIAHRGLPDDDVPSCVDCHGPARTPRQAAYPVLAAQHARYLALQLELFQRDLRGGTAFANLMHVFVDRLDVDDIDAVAAFFAAERPSPR